MQNTDERKVMSCPLNGKVCDNGRREDFPKTGPLQQIMQCRWWTHLLGKDPQSKKEVDQWDCAVAWLPITTTETAQMANQAGASMDKVANQVNEVGGRMQQLAMVMQGVKPKPLAIDVKENGKNDGPN